VSRIYPVARDQGLCRALGRVRAPSLSRLAGV